MNGKVGKKKIVNKIVKKIVNGNLFSDRCRGNISEKNSERNLPWKNIVKQIEGKGLSVLFKSYTHLPNPRLKPMKTIVKFWDNSQQVPMIDSNESLPLQHLHTAFCYDSNQNHT